MTSVPKQLQNPKFRFVLLGGWNTWKHNISKAVIIVELKDYLEHKKNKDWKPLGKSPFEKEWQTKNNYKFDDVKLINHQHNFGVIGGYGDLIILDIDERCVLIPAHAWTPWFGIFGSDSGFDSLSDCFQSQTDKIYAIETGMSSDPAMNWRIKELQNRSIVSFSDAHSFWPWRIGREATIFDIPELSYDNIIKAIRTGEGLKGTIETPPEYGRYHWDGHRNCNFSCGSEETKKLNGKCPKCGGNLIIGVEYRVEELAKKPKGFKPKNAAEFHKLLPLHELIVLYNNTGINSKGNWEIYNSLIEKFENEFNILLKVSKEELVEKEIKPKLIDLIMRNREDKIKIKPGYDGEYGVALLEEQKKLF